MRLKLGDHTKLPAYLNQKKSLSQVFLTTDWPVKRMVEKLKSWKVERVLEIGPGAGPLTRGLLEGGFQVTAVEKDGRFAERLRDLYRNDFIEGQRLTIVEEDFLRFSIPAWLESGKGTAAIVGNIPYHISSPILFCILPYLHSLAGAQLMVQLEFAQRLVAPTDTKDYGSLSVFCQLRATVELDCKVEKGCFKPVPKVDSAIVGFKARKDVLPADILKKTEGVCRAAFTQRRKKLRNAVRAFMKNHDEKTCPIDLERRAETLTPEDYVVLTKYFYPDLK